MDGRIPRGPVPKGTVVQQLFYPLRLGIQFQAIGAGGPSGFKNGTAGHVQPWPYITAFKNFISPGPYGAASTLVRRPINPNQTIGYPSFNPVGFTKKQTYTNVSF